MQMVSFISFGVFSSQETWFGKVEYALAQFLPAFRSFRLCPCMVILTLNARPSIHISGNTGGASTLNSPIMMVAYLTSISPKIPGICRHHLRGMMGRLITLWRLEASTGWRIHLLLQPSIRLPTWMPFEVLCHTSIRWGNHRSKCVNQKRRYEQ